MIAVYGKQRQRQSSQPALQILVPPSAVIIDAGVAQDDHHILRRRIDARTEVFNPVEVPVRVSRDIKHSFHFLARL